MQWQDWQQERLRRLLELAATTVPYYRDHGPGTTGLCRKQELEGLAVSGTRSAQSKVREHESGVSGSVFLCSCAIFPSKDSAHGGPLLHA